MNEKIVFGQYINGNSFVHKLDPRTKLITLFTLMIAVFLIKNIYMLVAFLPVLMLVVLAAKIPLKKFFKSFRMIVFLLVFTFVFQIIFNQTGDIAKIKGHELKAEFCLSLYDLLAVFFMTFMYFLSGKAVKKGRGFLFFVLLILAFILQLQYIPDNSLRISKTYSIGIYKNALLTSLKVLLRVIDLVSLSALLTFTTKPTEINNGIEGIFKPIKFMRSPISIFAMEISIALRSIPELLNETTKILKAQASRGVDFSEGGFMQKIKQIISLLVPMFVISYKKADALACAMEARAYSPGAERTRIDEFKYKAGDVVVYVLLVLFVCLLITGKVCKVL